MSFDTVANSTILMDSLNFSLNNASDSLLKPSQYISVSSGSNNSISFQGSLFFNRSVSCNNKLWFSCGFLFIHKAGSFLFISMQVEITLIFNASLGIYNCSTYILIVTNGLRNSFIQFINFKNAMAKTPILFQKPLVFVDNYYRKIDYFPWIVLNCIFFFIFKCFLHIFLNSLIFFCLFKYILRFWISKTWPSQVLMAWHFFQTCFSTITLSWTLRGKQVSWKDNPKITFFQ